MRWADCPWEPKRGSDRTGPAQFLYSHDLRQYMSQKSVDDCLSLSLNNPNQLVRAMSLKGLRSTLMHPKKVRGDAASTTPWQAPGWQRRLQRASTAAGIARGGGAFRPGAGESGSVSGTLLHCADLGGALRSVTSASFLEWEPVTCQHTCQVAWFML